MFDEIIARKDTMIFVAEEDGELLGLLSFFVLPNVRHGYHRGHVEDFFVSERARRKGVGTRLFEFMKEYCKKNGIRVVKLDSGNELAGAHEFYEKQGGKTTERFFRFDLE
jgi:GNAT superfamily N-acetyltransferase